MKKHEPHLTGWPRACLCLAIAIAAVVILAAPHLARADERAEFHLEAERIVAEANGDIRYMILAGGMGRYYPAEVMVPRSAWGARVSPRLSTVPAKYRDEAMAKARVTWQAAVAAQQAAKK